MEILNKIYEIGIVPVLVVNKKEDIIDLLDALKKGDIPIAEICYRTECAKDALKLAIEKFPELLIGAGTVINESQAEEAISLGAKFIVSPGFSDSVYDVCKRMNVIYLPGCVTPTEIMHAIDKGLTILKFFPAQVYGGLKAINAIGAAFPQIKFMPTGGVDNTNLKEFILNKKIYACGGSWITKGTKEEIIKNALDARKIIKENRE